MSAALKRICAACLAVAVAALCACVGPEPSSRLATEALLPVRMEGPHLSSTAIAERRRQAQQAYLTQTRDCQQRFAFHDCERTARRERNRVLDELRLHERALRDAELLNRRP